MIIDGIDVSECGFIHEDTGTECHIALAFSEEYGECWHCEQIENCYYKQLKRAEQENEKLKDIINKSVFLPNIEEQATNKYKKALMDIREIADALACKEPEKCYMNRPDWNGEVYGCDVTDGWKEPRDLADCPSKIANVILAKINEVIGAEE